MTVLREAVQRVAQGWTGALVVVLDGPARWAKFLVDESGAVVSGDAGGVPIASAAPALVAAIDTSATGVIEVGRHRWYVEVIAPDPRLLICGAGPIAEALCVMASRAGFRVDVVDPRAAFVSQERFPDAASVRRAWPDTILGEYPLDASTYVVSLLHEARLEQGLFPPLLRSRTRYIGALGSRRTHGARVEALKDLGFGPDEVARIRGPVGLDIGAVTPEEIAVAILAEMIAARRRPAGDSSGDLA